MPARPSGPLWRASPHRHGLGLIIGVMGEQQMQDAAPAAFVAQQPVAGRPRRLLQASPRLGARPGEDRAVDAVTRQQVGRRRRLARRFGAQAVVDDQADHAAAAPGRPVVRQQDQRQRIAAAGYGDGEDGRRLERLERRHQAREGAGAEWLRWRGAHPQPFFWRSCSTRRFCRSVARG